MGSWVRPGCNSTSPAKRRRRLFLSGRQCKRRLDGAEDWLSLHRVRRGREQSVVRNLRGRIYILAGASVFVGAAVRFGRHAGWQPAKQQARLPALRTSAAGLATIYGRSCYRQSCGEARKLVFPSVFKTDDGELPLRGVFNSLPLRHLLTYPRRHPNLLPQVV